MSLFDLLFFGLLALFIGVGVLRGGLREMQSLAVWVLAILCGWLFADAVSSWFAELEDVALRRLLAFLAIVMVMLAVLTLAVFILRILLPRPAPDLKSRMLGGVIGGVRGTFVVLVLVLLAGLTSLPKKEGWKDSLVVDALHPAVSRLLEWLPPPVARQFRYG